MSIPFENKTHLSRQASFPRALLAAVGIGTAFGAGVVLGGAHFAHAVPTEPEGQGVIARAELRTAELDRVRQGLKLSWHQELTGPEPARQPAPPLVVTKRAATEQKKPAPLQEPPSSPPMVDASMLSAPLEAAEPPAPRADDTRDDAAHADVDDEGDIEIARPDPRRLQAAMDKVLGAAAPHQAAVDDVDERRYAVQVASASSEAGAKEMGAKVKARGFDAVVIPADIPGKGTVYRVRVRGFASRAAADAAKARLGQGLVVADEAAAL